MVFQAEYEKRYLIELNRPMIVQSPNVQVRVSVEMQRMAAQVSEVLPYVPQDAIIRDLSEYGISIIYECMYILTIPLGYKTNFYIGFEIKV